MSWYRSGTVTVTNGSAVVTGAGTDFVANAQIGHAFLGPDGKVYEVAQVEAAGQIMLSAPYLGGSGAGQGYAIMPTSSFARDLALGAAQLLNTFATVRDTVGQGLFADGSLAAPGMRFTADQDTGLTRFGANQLCLVSGGTAGLYVNATRVLVPGHVDVGVGKFVAANVDDTFTVGGTRIAHYGLTMQAGLFGADAGTAISGYYGIAFYAVGTERARIDNFGNFLLGTATGAEHRICKNVPQGSIVAIIRSTASDPSIHSAAVCAVSGYTPNGATAALYLGHSTQTNRSLNASGTLNASGADYAEYMRKADGCGTIAKGDVCGVDGDGHLTKMWADARSFVVKSTDPSYVGGDTWGMSVGPRPEGPGEEPSAPRTPPAEPASEDEVAVEAWRAIVVAYPVQLAAYQAAHDAWADAKTAYDAALPAWEAALEAERQKVDRIAFAGQVPVNVSGDFAVGDYLIAAASGAGIKAVAVPADTITFDQYRRRLGKVWAVRDGRAWVDVQHG
jgi:hypothetical protein